MHKQESLAPEVIHAINDGLPWHTVHITFTVPPCHQNLVALLKFRTGSHFRCGAREGVLLANSDVPQCATSMFANGDKISYTFFPDRPKLWRHWRSGNVLTGHVALLDGG